MSIWLLECKVGPWARKRMKRKPSPSVNARQTDWEYKQIQLAAVHRLTQKLCVISHLPSTTSLTPGRESSLLGRVYVIPMVWVIQDNLISSIMILIACTKFLLPCDISEWAESYTAPSKTPTSQTLKPTYKLYGDTRVGMGLGIKLRLLTI